jgi:type I restriction enzyme S subunit
VSAKDVTGAAHGVITDTVEGISESAAKTKRLRPLPAGSVVLTARGTVGVVARLGIASAINQSCYGFVPDRVPGGCLTFVIEDASAQAKAMAHGSVFDTITMRTFDHVQVPALSDGEWRDVESVVAPLLAMTNQAVVESERLAATRDELLPLLMSGKVRVKDAEKPLEGVL